MKKQSVNVNTNNKQSVWVNRVLAHPLITVVLCVAGILWIGYYLQFVKPSVSYKDLLSPDNKALINYEAIQSEFTNDDNLTLLIVDKQQSPFNSQTLQAVRALTEQLWKIPFAIRVDSIANYQHTVADGDDLVVKALIDSERDLDANAVDEIKQVALSEPLLLNQAVNQAGTVLGINVTFAFPGLAGDEKLKSMSGAREVVKQFEADYTHLKAHIAGLVGLDVTVMEISSTEMGVFFIMIVLITTVFLIFLLKSVTPVIICDLVFIGSVVASMGVAGFMGWKLTPLSAAVPFAVLIIAVADCVHIVTVFSRIYRASGDKLSSLRQSLLINVKPVTLTSLTTAVGFLTLNYSESSMITTTGNQVAVGAVAALILSLTLLPALIVLLPLKRPSQVQQNTVADYGWLADWLFVWRKPIILVMAAISLTCIICIERNVFNDDIPKYFSTTLPWRQANDLADSEFGGTYTFTYKISAENAGGIAEPAYLQQLEQFVSWLRSQPEAVYVNSMVDTMKRLNKNMHNDEPRWYRLPESRELATQYLLLYEMSLPYGLDLTNQINLDKSATRVLVTFKTLSTTQVLAMDQRIDQWLQQHMPRPNNLGSGVQLMFAQMLERDVKGMVYGTTAGLIVISFLLIFAFKSFNMGLLSIAPNLLPILMAYGVWGILVGQVGIGVAMVSGISVGIIVDDTVHFLSKYLQGKRELKLDALGSVKHVFNVVGPSIVFTSIILMVGFLAMALVSEFKMNSDMGYMTAMIVFIALIFDLVALPIGLMIFDKQNAQTQTVKPSDDVNSHAVI
jgi:uncharacterized protein